MASLTRESQAEIDRVIDDLYQKIGVSYPENSLLEIARNSGVNVIETDLHEISPSLSGAILYDDPSTKKGAVIFIDKSIPKNRKTFTLAHELGHHFLHEGTKLRLDDLDYSKNDKEALEESEANYFAASLLVPKALLLRKLTEGMNINELAKYFDVSVPVIKNRLQWIKVN